MFKNAMGDAFKKARAAKAAKHDEGSPMEEKGESQSQEEKEQQKGVGDRAPSVQDHVAHSGAPHTTVPIHGDQMHGEHALSPEQLHTILSALMQGSKPGGGGGFDSAVHAGIKSKLKV